MWKKKCEMGEMVSQTQDKLCSFHSGRRDLVFAKTSCPGESNERLLVLSNRWALTRYFMLPVNLRRFYCLFVKKIELFNLNICLILLFLFPPPILILSVLSDFPTVLCSHFSSAHWPCIIWCRWCWFCVLHHLCCNPSYVQCRINVLLRNQAFTFRSICGILLSLFACLLFAFVWHGSDVGR